MDALGIQFSQPLNDLKIEDIEKFRSYVYDMYYLNRRSFSWRDTQDPYHILVSEVMLQQTQVSRVIDKYQQFLSTFPTIYDLAAADLRQVLSVWVGLGYNRRAMTLHRSARIIVQQFDGKVPSSAEDLVQLPGIGVNTVGSIQAFAFNYPSVFIETNIRSVMIYTWFYNGEPVHDRQIIPFVRQTLDEDNPREWYYALMDYGVILKRFMKNPSRKSSHYSKQSQFKGSDRQIRGAIIKHLTQIERVSWKELVMILKDSEERIRNIVDQLCFENLIRKTDDGCLTLCGL